MRGILGDIICDDRKGVLLRQDITQLRWGRKDREGERGGGGVTRNIFRLPDGKVTRNIYGERETKLSICT